MALKLWSSLCFSSLMSALVVFALHCPYHAEQWWTLLFTHLEQMEMQISFLESCLSQTITNEVDTNRVTMANLRILPCHSINWSVLNNQTVCNGISIWLWVVNYTLQLELYFDPLHTRVRGMQSFVVLQQDNISDTPFSQHLHGHQITLCSKSKHAL